MKLLPEKPKAQQQDRWHERTFKPKACVGCKQTFTPLVGGQKRCQPECGLERACVVCGTKFIPHRHKRNKQIACSLPCALKTRKFSTKICWECKKEFIPTSSNGRYCSEVCKRGKSCCIACGETFIVGKGEQGKFCSHECDGNYSTPVGTIRINRHGYKLIKVSKEHADGRKQWMLEHRYVVEKRLGRKLLPTETVHHLNGDKEDNKDENLELWASNHPRGIRI